MAGSLALRLLAAALPISMLAISRLIIDGVVAVSRGQPRPGRFWWWVGMEFGLACLTTIFSRSVDCLDALVGDRFISARVCALVSAGDRVVQDHHVS